MKLRPSHVDVLIVILIGRGALLALGALLIPIPIFRLVSFLIFGWAASLYWPSLTWNTQYVEIRNLRTHRIPVQDFVRIQVRHRTHRGVSFDAHTTSGKRIDVRAMFIPRWITWNEPQEDTENRLGVINSAIKAGEQLD